MAGSLGALAFSLAGICWPGLKMLWHVATGKWGGADGDLSVQQVEPCSVARRKWIGFEGNVPGDSRSEMAVGKKQKYDVALVELPKRPPDLQPNDYAVWAGANNKVRDSGKRSGGEKMGPGKTGEGFGRNVLGGARRS